MFDDKPFDNQKDTVTSKCDGCGANMVFDPEAQMLKCPHCGSVKDFEKSEKVEEIDILKAFGEGESWKSENSVYRCENCGAVVVLASGQTATMCPYCETSHVVKSDETAGLKPNAVYPFTVTQNSALEFSKKWAKSKLFAPRKFKKNLSAENFRGVYQPSFTFDSQTSSVYHGRIGKRHTRTVGSGKNRRTQTYIVWRNISGVYDEFFNDVLINGDGDYSQKTLDKISPYDYSTIKVYDDEYLTGFMAKRSNRAVESCWNDAKVKIDGAIKRGILSRYFYDVVDYLNVSTTHSKVTYKYVLLPVYLLNYKYGKKLYSVHINGNTGKVAGKSPVSLLRVLIATVLGIALVGLLGFLLYNYG